MLAIAIAITGDSAAGKTTLTKGLVEALGPERITAICVDDYHRYDRAERKKVPFAPLHPDCNYVEIMFQHLGLLAQGHPILKPAYHHRDGTLGRPVVVDPREFVIVEGLLPLCSRQARECFDATVCLDPPEPVRFVGRYGGTPANGATTVTRSAPIWPVERSSRPPTSAPSAPLPTSSCDSSPTMRATRSPPI